MKDGSKERYQRKGGRKERRNDTGDMKKGSKEILQKGKKEGMKDMKEGSKEGYQRHEGRK